MPADIGVARLRALLAGARAPGSSGWQRACCPVCEERHGSEDERYSLSINMDLGRYRCHRCDWAGSIRHLLQDLRDGPEEIEWTIDLSRARRSPPRWAPPAELSDPMGVLPAGYVQARPGDGGLLADRVLTYLRKRRLSDEQILRMRAGFTARPPRSGDPDARGRVILPVWAGGVVRSWVARSWGGLEPKVLNRRMDAGGVQPLWGVDEIQPGGLVVIVEGIFDAIATPCGVALLGSRLSDEELFRLLAQAPRRILVALDNEPAAQAKAARIVQAIRDVWPGPVQRIEIKGGKDPSDLGLSAMRETVSAEATRRVDVVADMAGAVRRPR